MRPAATRRAIQYGVAPQAPRHARLRAKVLRRWRGTLAVARALGRIVPANYKPIDAAQVARALLAAVPVATGRHVLLSGSMRRALA